MVGSAQGWVEVPYCPLPAGPTELATRLVRIREADLAIVPGLVQDGGGATPDVMRGEETQIAGALARHPALQARARLVMPGTHSKWVEVTDGRVVRFTTWMTGEVFGVLRQHSILGRLAPNDAPAAEAAFLQGVDAARDATAGVASRLFSARALVLTGRLPAEESLEYLSGLLIGDEIKGALQDQAVADGARNAKLTLIGDAALCRRYRQALARFGAPAPEILDNTAPWGLWRIAAAAGLVPAHDG
jgi:2-dehydro-3-deoxygalactonokinase